MALTPLDIQNKNFQTKMRGYEKDEVDDFLDIIVKDYEEVVQRNRELEKSLKHSEEKLEYFNELKDALNQSIVVAQDTADKVKKSANKESEVVVTSAQNKADELVANAEKQANQLTEAAQEKAKEILSDATQKARELTTETNDLKKKTRVFHNNLSLMLETQLEQVKSPEWDEILAPFSSYVQDSHEVFREILAEELDKENDSEVNSEQVDTEQPSSEEQDTQDEQEDVSVVESSNRVVPVSTEDHEDTEEYGR
ncbi:DivIVA domain-containing protein [Tetragenococcus halophilus]|uniref:Cell division protein DivIVA n=2 Tax=Tetragenococcus halophilus TaxID=51669 RepID=A0A2H6CQ14_TETHA|nr:DivIVA domain-containing protein [Tetragenococcus halophilus]AOF49392.1 cell division protein DivIVA [Tetragenococcus halophilus]AYW51111.1 DivIVA domain-containing protein [Tetragenococcus halophilus]MCF1601380.1 DivIVA domain-containing protein [Tetragenococcus halophilus]MCF1674701.1 DivIVA domain-containing protein [Tetragenococcus halophilus]MCO8286780.1 DivIVA domain-containing protein [Tetragenococcus halophilus]